VYEERFAKAHGPLRPVVERVSILWAEWLREEVLEPVPHRHVVLTMPRLLRGIFRKRRELRLDLSQCGAEALTPSRPGTQTPSCGSSASGSWRASP